MEPGDAVDAVQGSAYRMSEGQVDDAITRVGRGTPAGELLRRYWHPIAASEEVLDLPIAVRILGEDLILFRDKQGNPGLVYPRCIHRGASLFYGRVEDAGIRCCYHGWLFDVTGRCLEQPCEPGNSAKRAGKFRQPWYPVEERYGIVFAYMGPLEEKPPVPRYEWLEDLEDGKYSLLVDAHHTSTGDPQPDYNWLQKMENGLDPFHVYVLHNGLGREQFHPYFTARPKVTWKYTETGIRTATERSIDGHTVHRVGEVIFPTLTVSGNPLAHGFDKSVLFVWKVPVDDCNTIDIVVFRATAEVIDLVKSGEFERQLFPQLWKDMTPEERQRGPGDYEAQRSQGPITLHSEENLVTSDIGVGMYRRMLRSAIVDVQNGARPLNIQSADAARPLVVIAGNYLDEALNREIARSQPEMIDA